MPVIGNVMLDPVECATCRQSTEDRACIQTQFVECMEVDEGFPAAGQ